MVMFSDEKLLERAREAFTYFGELFDGGFSLRLWDGSVVPLGAHADPQIQLSVSGPGVISSVMRRPNLETLLRLYAAGHIDVQGANLYEFMAIASVKGKQKRLGELSKGRLLGLLWPFLLASGEKAEVAHEYADDAVGRVESKRSNKDFIQFHYDISNAFYALFLDPEMLYSCGYFKDMDTPLARAQQDKLDHICRKLRLKPGDKFLDIGCGWGGLVCHAARHYGVKAHGVTLSRTQHDFAQEKIRMLGLEESVTVELRDYETLSGTYDKISSVGMFEHVGIDNMPKYFGKIRSLLRDRGILMNHGISRTAKKSKRAVRKIRPERKLLLKYIFPGSELDNVGHTVDLLQMSGFEVHDVEGLREHYGLTCKAWHDALLSNRDEAISIVGLEKYRMWIIYLAGVATGFTVGSMHIFQVVASRHSSKGPSELPLTRDDLYI
ncbi:MAG: cyclopropane-fatty-acyl-phospholipid synthase family protein [Pseudomonadota bacterium]|nr:cyclopropane-fatty-acyl-phospholipid synthase family protein [Pseudomonadota bacterium]